MREVWLFFQRLHRARMWHLLAVTMMGFGTTTSFVVVLLPLLEAAGASSVSDEGPSLSLAQSLGLFLILGIAQGWWYRYQTLAGIEFRESTIHLLIARLNAALEKVRWDWLIRHRMSDLVHAMQVDIERVAGAAQVLVASVSQAMLATVYLIMALYVGGPQMGVLLPIGALFLPFSLARLGRANVQGTEFASVVQDQSHHLGSFLNGYKAFHSHGAGKVYLSELRRLTDKRRNLALEVAQEEMAQGFFVRVFSLVGLTGFLWWAVTIRLMPAAQLLVLLYALARLAPCTQALASLFTQLSFTAPTVFKLDRLLVELGSHHAQEGEHSRLQWTSEEEVRLEKVVFRYPSGRGLGGVDLRLRNGSWTCLTGPSGSGKSTLADILLGLLEPDEGCVFLGGAAFQNRSTWRNAVAYVPQQVFFFSASLRENLWLGESQADKDSVVWHLLEQLGLAARCQSFSCGLDTVMLDSGQDFSVGERQRLGLVRALLREPVLLVLDEPTANLDPESEELVIRTLKHYDKRLTVLVVSHQAGWLKHVDQVCRLVDGCLEMIATNATVGSNSIGNAEVAPSGS